MCVCVCVYIYIYIYIWRVDTVLPEDAIETNYITSTFI